MLTLNDGRSELWQWDTGRTLSVDADCSQVHFSNKVFGRSIDVDVVDGVAGIPDILLQSDKDLNVWAFVGTAENGYTKISKTFKVNRRNKPADYVFTPQEQVLLKDAIAIVETAKSAANDAIESAKQAEDSSTQAAKSEGAAADSASAAAASEQAAAQSAAAADKRATDAEAAKQAAAQSAAAADKRATDAEAAKQAAAQSAAAADKRATDAAKSAADADSTANIIKDSMAQISKNKEAVSQLKDDLAAEQTAREQADTSLQQGISGKLPKSPADWEPWTAEEQSAARDRMNAQGPYKHIATITIDEDGVYNVGIDRDENGMVFSVSDVYIYGYIKKTGSISSTAVAINTTTTTYNGSNNIIKLPSNYQANGAQFELNIKKSKYWRAYTVSSIGVSDPNINNAVGSTSVSHRGASNVRENEWETLTALAFATSDAAFGIGTTFDIWGR